MIKMHESEQENLLKKVCCEQGFTTFSDDEIPPSMKGQGKFLETELSEWERQQSFTIEKLIKDRSIKKITPEEFWELVRFAVWLHQCNPALRQMLRKGIDKFHLHKIRSYNAKNLDELSMSCFGLLLPHAFLRKMLDSTVPLIGLLQSEFLGLALGGAEKSFDIVSEQYSWILDDYKDSGLLLCTSDRPVLLAGPQLNSYIGFGTPGVTLHFPLSPDLCLVGCNLGKDHRTIQPHYKVTDPRLADRHLALIAAKSINLIVAPDPALLPPDGTELPSYLPEIINLGNMFGMGMR